MGNMSSLGVLLVSARRIAAKSPIVSLEPKDTMRTDPIFQTVAATFFDLGTGDAPISRSALLRENFFFGHCFRCGDFHAIRKPDSTVIEFFGADGELRRTLSVEEVKTRAAA